MLKSIEQAVLGLSDLSERGNFPKELAAIGIKDYREVHFKSYRMIYRRVGQDVIVYCVVDGRRDMRSFLERRLLR